MTRQEIKQRFGIIGNSEALNQAIDIAMQAAPADVTVLVLGENGTGKDVFPRIVHQLSPRRHKPYFAVNSGAIPEGTIDSELFGHEKGSFTSAHESRKGYFEEANGGVVFLDEIAEMPTSTQARLLRVLENGEFIRVGSSKVQKTDVRVVAATNRRLVELIHQGKFREDLYYRLNTITIQVPPLRERGEDIELLFRYFAREFADRYGREAIRLEGGAAKLLQEYRWPGNVRELRNFVEKLSILISDGRVTETVLKEHLPIGQTQVAVSSSSRQQEHSTAAPNADMDVLMRLLLETRRDVQDLKQAFIALLNHQRPYEDDDTTPYDEEEGGTSQGIIHVPSHLSSAGPAYNRGYGTPGSGPVPASQGGGGSPERIRDYNRDYSPEPYPEHGSEGRPPHMLEESLSLERKEKDLIYRALNKHSQNRKKAAEELGISERTLYRKLKQYEDLP